jgi:hypothetical protein
MMKKLTVILILFFSAFSFLTAQTNVTFQVNLNNATDLYDGGSVWVYMDAGWNEFYTMTDDDADGVYTFTLARESGSTLPYRYSYQNGPDENSNYVEENVPDACSNDDGFREMTVPDTDVTLDLVAYGSCDENVASTVNVTFKVDMSNEDDPNDVQVVIKNPWIWTALSDQGNGIWSATVEVDANSTYPYTFVNGGQDNWGGEESVPEECNFGTPSAPERNVTVEAEDLVLDLVAFGSCDDGQPVELINVTINVDLNGVADLHPDGGVWVYMDAGWSEYYDMTDDDDDGIYSVAVEQTPESTLTYRFSYQNGPDSNNDYTEENVPAECANMDGFREVVLPAHDISLDAVAYETCSGDPVFVTVQVNLNNVEDFYDGGGVWLYMDSGWSEFYDMTDDDSDGIYTYSVERSAGDVLTYRFSYQNGPDSNNDYTEENVPDLCSNDDGFRYFLVPDTDVTLPVFAYGSCDNNVIPKVNVTFQVDMNQEANPNDVQVVIKNPWIWTALTDQGGGVWSGTVEVDANNTYPYTYVNGGQDNWDEEESVPEECNFGTPSAPERHVEVAEEDIVLDLVSFGSCTLVSSVEEGQLLKMTIYPNPANQYINITEASDFIQSVEIFDVSGKLIQSNIYEQALETSVNIQNIDTGIYFIRVQSNSGTINRKLVIE